MIKTILYNLKRKFTLFLNNRYINEYLAKLYINEIHKKLKNLKVNQYALSGYKVYSQNEEDGIIEAIFNDIGVSNKLFCEIGIGNTIENNTHNLVLNNWRGLWIDINPRHIRNLKKKIIKNQNIIEFINTKVTPQNINDIISVSKILKNKIEIDFLSIDIDSYDILCVKKLKSISPRLICIEYNSKIRPNLKIDIKNLEKFQWKYDDYFGSSLKSIDDIMNSKCYQLVATNITGSNAFYVKKSLAYLCRTKDQSLNDLYSPPNFELFNYNVSHAPSNKYLIDKLNE